MAETLPIVNAIDNLKESNKDQRERLQKSMRAGLLNVVRSIQQLNSNLSRIGLIRSPTPEGDTSNEPHFFDKLSTWFEFQTSQGAKKIAELENRNREQGKTILGLNKRIVDELVPALDHLQEEISKLVRYTKLQLKQAAVSTGVQVTPRVQTLNKRLAEFDDLQMLLKQQQEQLRLSHNQYAPLHYEPIIEEIKSKLEEMKKNIRISSDLEERKKLRDVYTASMRVVKSIDANEERVAEAVKENTDAIKGHGSKVDANTDATRKNTNKRDEGDKQERKLFTNLFNKRGPLYNIFADIKEGNNRIHKWLKEKWNGEDETGRGNLGPLAATVSLLTNPLVWRLAYYGVAAYGAGKIFEGAKQGYEIATKPEEEWSPETKAEWERMQRERKKEMRESMRRMGHDIGPEEDPDSPVNRSKLFWGQLYDYVPDWMKTTEGNQNDPGILDAGKEFWNKFEEKYPTNMIEGSSPANPKEEGPSWWQKLLGIGDAGAADVTPSARPSSVETNRGMEGFKVLKRSAEQAAQGQTIIVDSSNKVGDTNNTQITNNQNTYAPISASPTIATPSNSDYWGRPILEGP